MPILISCPSCNRQLRIPDEVIGKLVKCPSCETKFTATADEPPAPINDRGEILRDDREEDRPAPQERESFRPEDAPGVPPPSRRRYEEDDERDFRRPSRDRYRDRGWDDDRYRDRRTEARSRVAGPAIALIIVGSLGIVMAMVLLFITVLIALGPPNQQQDPDERTTNLIGNCFSAGLNLTWGILLFQGGTKMKQLKSYGLAMTASIIAMLPCSGCCILGLPFGIWALVVLCQPDIKQSFR